MEILIVSIPVATEEIIFALVAIILNYLIMQTSRIGEVDSFDLTWRFITIAYYVWQ